ncbi:hypothetical protein EAO71_33745 [Streptomyces sp. ms191]|uniref:hypothetical protein n=1 Tax=Streptomyces sp. ms191 TaxID=1827978 RepID=UPI0011CD892F|nr:hypothetical protein [Streptomyces sp. ms191]TXS19579.1 hypothetical protein EAO71_33745 [Streptomyces sp. ms191]
MNTTTLAINLVDALRDEGQRVATATPAIRGGDWQTAVVTAVATDGTLTAAGISGIRRVQNFTDPLVGDTIVISQGSSGSWIAEGRLASSTGEWTALPFAAGFSATPTYQVPQYRVVGQTVHMRGGFTKSSTLVSGDVFTTLPVGARPLADHDMVIAGSHGTAGAGIGAFRGILRANGNFEYRGPSVSTIVSIPPTIFWLT